MAVAYIITVLTPLVILFILYSLDTFGIQPRRYVVQALIWGGAAFVFCLGIESGIAVLTHSLVVTLAVAPIIEEVIKALPLRKYMIDGKLVNAVDGLSFGFEIGLSFGMAENLFYLLSFTGNTTEAVGFAAARVLTSGLMHAVATGMIGAVAGHAARYSQRRQRLYFYSSVVLAILFHFVYNMAVVSLDGVWLMLVALGIGLAGLGIMFTLVRREVRWVHQQVLDLSSDAPVSVRLSAADPQALAAALDKYKSALGQDMVQKIERYSALMAQQTLLRSALAGLGNSRHRAAVEARLRTVNGQLAVLNADIGLFMRVWMGMLVTKDEDLRSALATAEISTAGDPLLNLALQLAGRTAILSEEDLAQRKRLLSHSRLFRGLGGPDLEDVALMMDRLDCRPGDPVLRREAPNEAMYLVSTGRFQMQLERHDGATANLGDLYPGEVFGLASALGDRQVTSDVVCTQLGSVYFINRTGLISLIYGNPRISLVLLGHMAQRVQEWGELIQQLSQPEMVEVPLRLRS